MTLLFSILTAFTIIFAIKGLIVYSSRISVERKALQGVLSTGILLLILAFISSGVWISIAFIEWYAN